MWAYRVGDATSIAYVRAGVADPVATLNAAFADHLGFVPGWAEIAAPPALRTAARPREADKIEIEWGDRGERKAAERGLKMRIAETVLAKGDVVDLRSEQDEGYRMVPVRVVVWNRMEKSRI